MKRGEFYMRSNAKSRLRQQALRQIGAAGAVALMAALSGCSTIDENAVHRGYVFDEQSVSQVRVGSAAEQVLILLGTPSTTSTVGGDAWYYISQKAERPLPFVARTVTDQRVLAVYFDKNKKVTRVANYGLQDGRVVDFSSNATPTGGGDSHFVQSLFKQMSNLKFSL